MTVFHLNLDMSRSEFLATPDSKLGRIAKHQMSAVVALAEVADIVSRYKDGLISATEAAQQVLDGMHIFADNCVIDCKP